MTLKGYLTTLGSSRIYPFRYPRARHTRRLSPVRFSAPVRYKPILGEEFHHACVYCTLPDAFNHSFEVEHYRPEVLFPELANEYSNLFYSCRACNGRKGKRWFEPSTGAAYIVNPCQDIMTDHLWFNSLIVECRSIAGKLTEEVLQLNDEETVKARQTITMLVKDSANALRENKRKKKTLLSAIKKEKDTSRKLRLQEALTRLVTDIEIREAVLKRVLRS